MTSSLSSSIVAVLDPDGRVVGTGFVAGARLIVSCAHVVSSAGGQPGGAVRVRFHLGGEVRQAAVAQWDAENDLAILRLAGELPGGVAPLTLGKSAEATGKPFRAFGYPDVGTDGSNADGAITGPTRGKDGQDLLQLKSSQLAQGFSGGPVLVNDIVIGVVTAVYHPDRTLKNLDTAWAIPIELARQLSPELATPIPAYWPLGGAYATSPNFTGRVEERAALSAWLKDGPTVLVMRALGGFGKSALAWHWLANDVDSKQWQRALWWNFYDERTFETFVAEALAHLGLEARTLGPRQQADKLLEQLTQSGTLLILDGFERALRAFEGMDAAYQGDEPHPSSRPSTAASANSASAQDATTGEGEKGGEALSAARRTLELTDETARTHYPHERDYVHAHWLLGAAHRANGEHDEAERHLNESLTRCRSINAVYDEADILIDLARLRAAMGEPEEAARLAQEALAIAGRCGYALQAADAHLELAKLALSKDLSGLSLTPPGFEGSSQDPTGLAIYHAHEARRLATCDGEPYVYRVAYEEAGALLAQLGEKL